MRKNKEVIIPERKEESLHEVVCESCGLKSNRFELNGIYGPSVGNFGDSYEQEIASVYYYSGHRYPEGGFGEGVFFDICHECFNEKLAPFLESIGCKPQKYNKDF